MSGRTYTEQMRAKFLEKPMKARGREERTDPATIDNLLVGTTDSDPKVRCQSVQHLCPCHVQAKYDHVWDRLIVMVHDPDPKVRRTVLHTLADGSPHEREAEVVAAIESLYNDPDRKLRKQVRHVLTIYRHTGKINIL